jgi:DNA-binding cell septation regulator SpoVG
MTIPTPIPLNLPIMTFVLTPREFLRADGTYVDIVHPLNNETRQMIQDRVVAEYEKIAGEPVKTSL